MAKSETSRIESLDALLAEKRKYEGFLAKLGERRESTPTNVFERLRDEYLGKLTDAQVRAAIEAESLGEGLRDHEVAVTEIETRLAAMTEERIEGELRAAVGEYDPKEWAERLKALTGTHSKAEKERDVKIAAFERTRHLLLEAGAAPMVGGMAASAVRVSSPPASPPKVVNAPDAPGPSEAQDAASVASAVGSPIVGGPTFGEIAFGNSVLGRASIPATAPVHSPRTTAATVSLGDVDPNSTGRPAPRKSPAIKTLKCAECSTLNFPTEWYCERCGGELATL